MAAGSSANFVIVRSALLEAWPLPFPLLAFTPFLADATITLARRVLRGEAFWRAHRSHYYQRLVLAGWSRRRLAVAAYVLMAAAAASAWTLRSAEANLRFAIIACWVALYAALCLAIERTATDHSGAFLASMRGAHR